MYIQIIELNFILLFSTVLESFERQLDKIFPDACGSRVTLHDAKSVAREVSACCSTNIRNLAFNLDVSCPIPPAGEVDASQVLQLLKEWLKNSEKNAVLAVLTDALQDCDLGKVIRN